MKISIFRHRQQNSYNFAIEGHILTKLPRVDDGPLLKKSVKKTYIFSTAPPCGNRNIQKKHNFGYNFYIVNRIKLKICENI